jgi:hypothetical protein
MKLLLRRAGATGRRAGSPTVRAVLACGLAGLAALAQAGAAGAVAPRPSAVAPTAERAALERRAFDLIVQTIRQRAVRPLAEAIIERDARWLAATTGERELRDAVARGDASALIDAALARAAMAAPLAKTAATAAPTLGDSNSDLLFVPVPPCRIIDTRVAGGALAANETRSYLVNGSTGFLAQGGNGGGCGIPADAVPPSATAAVLNFVAVAPQGPGDLRAWAYGQPKPLAAVLNYAQVTGLNIANGVVVPVAGSSLNPADLNVSTDVSGTHLVVDVTGYFIRFPIEGFQVSKPTAIQADNGAVSLASSSLSSCPEVNSCTVTATSTGHVLVQVWTQVNIEHTQGTHDRAVIGIKSVDPTICSDFNQTVNSADFEVPDVFPSDPAYKTELQLGRVFFQSATSGNQGMVTYFINAAMVIGASAGDQIENSRMICTFYPD